MARKHSHQEQKRRKNHNKLLERQQGRVNSMNADIRKHRAQPTIRFQPPPRRDPAAVDVELQERIIADKTREKEHLDNAISDPVDG